MKHRISAGAIVFDGDRILLVRHKKEGSYDFWVAPGGGVIDTEGICQAAKREVREETGLNAEPIRPVYLEEFHEPTTRHIKTWVLCELLGGAISVEAEEATREHIVEARFFTEDEVMNEPKDVFPLILRDRVWEDKKAGFGKFEYLGLRAMEYF
ncbi:NUDIX domain-containing protein [Cerasicoccus frondis]|uniref:NUDIX domain-containing protein n=1 Tax=Cerasicoccus frondis TaxID=490090 RepID=UPI002852A854|nr:NUDIX domain-containing protein [Cerasicoccus frondis]